MEKLEMALKELAARIISEYEKLSAGWPEGVKDSGEKLAGIAQAQINSFLANQIGVVRETVQAEVMELVTKGKGKVKKSHALVA